MSLLTQKTQTELLFTVNVPMNVDAFIDLLNYQFKPVYLYLHPTRVSYYYSSPPHHTCHEVIPVQHISVP